MIKGILSLTIPNYPLAGCVSMENGCEQCKLAFKSKDAKRHHDATTHIDVCVISTTIKITRTNGVYKCVCGSSTKSSRKILEHKQCYLSHQSTLVNGTEPTEQSTITYETDMNQWRSYEPRRTNSAVHDHKQD